MGAGQPPAISNGWYPGKGFIPYDWTGYDEGMIVYILALGSPTYPVEPAAWDAWLREYQWGSYYGQPHVEFAPLFGHQYSHVWVDFRGIKDRYMRDKGIDYFENSRRATYAQRSYAIDDPMRWSGYGEHAWGLTASDGPGDAVLVVGNKRPEFFSYRARGADRNQVVDDGTIVPTAAGGSMPFAPEIALPALVAMRERRATRSSVRYGFVDAYNLTYPDQRLAARGPSGAGTRLVRRRLSGNRPGADPCHDGELANRARLAVHAPQSLISCAASSARASRVDGSTRPRTPMSRDVVSLALPRDDSRSFLPARRRRRQAAAPRFGSGPSVAREKSCRSW